MVAGGAGTIRTPALIPKDQEAGAMLGAILTQAVSSGAMPLRQVKKRASLVNARLQQGVGL